MGKHHAKYQVKTLGIEEYQALTACQKACPVGTDTKRYVRAIAEGEYEKAFLIARQTNPLVSICSRVCTAPCEAACRKGETGSPVDIRALKRFACDRQGVVSPRSVAQKLDRLRSKDKWLSDLTGNDITLLSGLFGKRKEERKEEKASRVAIVGSGPAGLAAAHDLALMGYRVTIFEASAEAGGQLQNGIPGFRLPKEIVRQEIEAILDLGVELRLNSPIGKETSLADLRARGYEAVFITVGLQNALKLKLTGSELKGVYTGLDYVRDHRQVTVGKTCLVIGGGGVAIDCAQHALRQGAKKVMIACLESWETMPASHSDKEDAQEEGIEFHNSLGPQRIVGENGRAIGVEFLEVSAVFDGEGKFNPSFVPGSDTTLTADTVILAVGQSSSLPFESGMEGVEVTRNGLIRAAGDLSTNVPGVFAGGDVRLGVVRTATEAMADGQKAARAIHGYLGGKAPRLSRKGYMKPVAAGFDNSRCETIAPEKSPKRGVEERVQSREEITLGYDEAQAREQAARCRQCNIQTVFDRSRCLLCGTCVDSCTGGALKLVRVADIQGDEQVQSLTGALEKKSPKGKGMTAIIKDESRCVSCGTCARRCPGGAITMSEFFCQEEIS